MSDHQQQAPSDAGGAPAPAQVGSTTPVRVDAWLWSVRLFKTRSAATTACRAGHVKIDGQPVKASVRVTPGTTIHLRRPGHELIIEVVRTLSSRVGAPAARQAYRDHSPERIRPRDVGLPVRPRGAGRPTKRERRQLDRLRGE
ncbi:MAG TPA: RNA-binding S4 domain-containing protein [Candidatus Nesterenkonia stercoripullorum]|uniref:RNA-binding S4 domain-containing protein n=1 Tax=Candidatus Nesterenkonia stercoripullorum TaxID=2838701 RepID=A0A9D1UTR0_9MICC|nr:RNA-binding S4 domain-containing protein [Candidatus Nesterenkonia stercoripullorum]